MKNYVITRTLKFIQKSNSYDDIKLAEIRYGLVSIYLMITKLVVIIILSLILGIFKEFLIFIIIYNIIRMPSFGLHATKSWVCLLTSTLFFVGIPYLCMSMRLDVWMKCIIGILGICFMYKNSPADTQKKPIVSMKRRTIYKFISTMLGIVFVTLSLIIKDLYISNCFIAALILQCFIISPLIYKIFGLPYDNYKDYLIKHPEFTQ